MKLRRHHNNKGFRQIKRGQPARSLERMARKLKLAFTHGDQSWRDRPSS